MLSRCLPTLLSLSSSVFDLPSCSLHVFSLDFFSVHGALSFCRSRSTLPVRHRPINSLLLDHRTQSTIIVMRCRVISGPIAAPLLPSRSRRSSFDFLPGSSTPRLCLHSPTISILFAPHSQCTRLFLSFYLVARTLLYARF